RGAVHRTARLAARERPAGRERRTRRRRHGPPVGPALRRGQAAGAPRPAQRVRLLPRRLRILQRPLPRPPLTHRLVMGAHLQGADAGLNRPIVLRAPRRGMRRKRPPRPPPPPPRPPPRTAARYPPSTPGAPRTARTAPARPRPSSRPSPPPLAATAVASRWPGRGPPAGRRTAPPTAAA